MKTRALAALEMAVSYREQFGVNRVDGYHFSARTEYAIRRVGGLRHLEDHMELFLMAYNEAPFVDANEDSP